MSEYLLQTRGLTKQYGRHKAVENVDIHISTSPENCFEEPS